ncbi:MAG: serine/threonine protein kinase [Cyanobacteria bacterium P01_E01_bin.42]
MLGQTLNERYQIMAILGSGGFGRTYLARDTHYPDNLLCTVKQLQVGSPNSQQMERARETFSREAETLKQLGVHPQIPQVLSYFEGFGDFFLVQEYVEGHPLTKEIVVGDRWEESKAIEFLSALLPLLEFIHARGVIHRDIKPDNILRRQQDNRLILVDFGNIKQIYQSETGAKVAIGTPGYMASEQFQGNAYFCSDIYSVGTLVIQALTGFHPQFFQYDSQTGDILWQKNICSPALAAVLNRMVSYRFGDRYQSAREILKTIEQLQIPRSHTELPPIASVSSYPLPPPNPPQFSVEGPALATVPRRRRKKTKVRKSKSPRIALLFFGLPAFLIFALSFGITVSLQRSSRTPMATPQPSPQAPANSQVLETTASNEIPANSCTVQVARGLNIRARPNGAKVGGMVQGERAILTGLEDGNWVEISNPIQGWVAKNYLQCAPSPFVERASSPAPILDAGEQLLQTAFASMEAGELSDAIAMAGEVQPDSSAYRDAQTAITQWRRIQERYQAMQQARRSRRWQDILIDLNTNGLPESPYWRNKFIELGERARSRN